MCFGLIVLMMTTCYCPPTDDTEYGYDCGYDGNFGEGVCHCHFVDSVMTVDCRDRPALSSTPSFTSTELDLMQSIDMTGTRVCQHNNLTSNIPPSVRILCGGNNGDAVKTRPAKHVAATVTPHSFRWLIVGVSVACVVALGTTVTTIVICRVSAFLFQHIVSANEVQSECRIKIRNTPRGIFSLPNTVRCTSL